MSVGADLHWHRDTGGQDTVQAMTRLTDRIAGPERSARLSARAADLSTPDMPYMDLMLDGITSGDEYPRQLFERHLHGGYWPEPTQATGTAQDFAEAAERMAIRMYEAAGVRDEMRILDCGCGIGGTTQTINERFSGMRLTALNIDPRQLALAKKRIEPCNGNEVEFVHANACDLPFDDNSFDAVLAVECIFHFPSRVQFFGEVRRVLLSGRRLAVSDVVPAGYLLPVYQPITGLVPFFGYQNPWTPSIAGYRIIARRSGLRLAYHEDVTRNTLPSSQISDFYAATSASVAFQSWLADKALRSRLLRYKLMTFIKR